MKNCVLILLLFFNLTDSLANETDSLLIRLNKVMDNKEYYVKSKEQTIQKFKQVLTIKRLLPRQIYDINRQLYEEYKKYQSDSAVHYVLHNREIANQIEQEELKQETTIQLAWLYSTQGMYIESQELLESIDKNQLSERLLPDYYDAYDAFCSRYGQSTNNRDYYQKSEQYRDSLLSALDPQSLRYRIAYAAKMLYSGQNAEPLLLSLMDETAKEYMERGIVAYFLGYMYRMWNNPALCRKYYTLSAIADIENCTKDNASLYAFALICYEAGDIDRAYKFMQSAIDDAVFCNVRYRTVEFSASYPIINASYQAKEKKQKANLQISLITISILFLFLTAGIFYIYRQMKRLSLIRKELYRTNQQLSILNKDLRTANDQLHESNLIKEEYIAHFFDLCSTYIAKLENYRKTLNKHASNHHIDELFRMLRSTTLIENELEELYKQFDIIFLSLYPTFVNEFKALQSSDELLILKPDELLNTALRIFALIRLGITDSIKIAGFLRYSISTIYNYRVKARNNATVPRDQFEEMVMKIGNYTQNA
jgi:hypothetical protein